MNRLIEPVSLSRTHGTPGTRAPMDTEPAAPLLANTLEGVDGTSGRRAPNVASGLSDANGLNGRGSFASSGGYGESGTPATQGLVGAAPGHGAAVGSAMGPGAGLGASPDAWTAARRVAPLAVDVLLQGETGAGKDALAREIHRWSGRHGKFIAINCAAIPEHLAESELFGHEAGAFTGAVKAREGKLEAADKGTLYLDEIDSMPLESQAKLLRALQERGAERLGGSRFYRADFRVIASTKVPLPALVRQGRFRQDLYFRLNVVKLQLLPLRDSPDRVQQLFETFAREASERHGLAVPPLVAGMRQRLLRHHWPGNVRELRNAAERHVLGFEPLDEEMAAMMGVAGATGGVPPGGPQAANGFGPGSSAMVPLGDAEPSVSGALEEGGSAGSLRDRMRNFERELIVHTLKHHGGSVAKASADLQVPPNTLYYRIKTLGIQFTPE